MPPPSLARQPPGLDAPTLARGLPKAPVFGWDNLWPQDAGELPCIGGIVNHVYTSSGRAALYAALLQMRLAPRSRVLVPTYHCPTMVAPIVHAGHEPLFYPLTSSGLPNLEWVDAEATRHRPAAMFLPHFFGLAVSLSKPQAWCRAQDVVLVEDCAHTYFGMAGELPVGHWGDYATASLSKFFPVPEGGLIARAAGQLTPLQLQPLSARDQLKAAWDVIDFGCRQGRLTGPSQLLAPLRWLRDHGRTAATPEVVETTAPGPASTDCDMGRIGQQATAAARAVHRSLPGGRIVARRRANYAALAEALDGAPGAHPLQPRLQPGWAPYAMPLWVDGASRTDRVYARLREWRLPVFRWDRLWPGTPAIGGDTGPLWSRHLLQLLCHQDLSPRDIQQFAARVRDSLRSTPHA